MMLMLTFDYRIDLLWFGDSRVLECHFFAYLGYDKQSGSIFIVRDAESWAEYCWKVRN